MKFIFISGAIFLLLSIAYLAYLMVKAPDDENKIVHFIKCRLLPILSGITILGIFIFLLSLSEDFIFVLFLIIFLFIAFLILFDGPKFIGTVATILCIFFFVGSVFNEPIIIDETYTTTTVPLYNTSVIRDDLVVVELNISSDTLAEKKYHALMQYSVNDTKNLTIPNTLNCKSCKLINSQDEKIEIKRKELTTCNIFYYFDFSGFTPETIIEENSTTYVAYINPENIIYE